MSYNRHSLRKLEINKMVLRKPNDLMRIFSHVDGRVF